MTKIVIHPEEKQLRQLLARLGKHYELVSSEDELIGTGYGCRIDFMRDSAELIAHKMYQIEQQHSVEQVSKLPLLEIAWVDCGMACYHNMPCAVEKNEPAVYDGTHGVFIPSWKAQEKGWRLVRFKTKFQRWLLNKFFHKDF